MGHLRKLAAITTVARSTSQSSPLDFAPPTWAELDAQTRPRRRPITLSDIEPDVPFDLDDDDSGLPELWLGTR